MADDPQSPYILRMCHNEIVKKSYNELVGLCKGLIADNKVSHDEATFLYNWLQHHPLAMEAFPAQTLANRLCAMLLDDIFDDDEAQEILLLLQDMTGEQGNKAQLTSTTLIGFDTPMPEIDFVARRFVLTGTFQYGRRKDVVRALDRVNAFVANSITKSNPTYLVVGALVTDSWKFSTHGLKFENAVKLRDNGSPIAIVNEDHMWNEAERQGLAIYD
ncbi:BRCT domain-containing protein [Desulfosarcina sp. OttesenSCG-928-B08]|nr:BRCT domain-containing protein [Desulfosarcina sp. OttesenSCG-928-B08]